MMNFKDIVEIVFMVVVIIAILVPFGVVAIMHILDAIFE